jgi:hypothetical protein
MVTCWAAGIDIDNPAVKPTMHAIAANLARTIVPPLR